MIQKKLHSDLLEFISSLLRLEEILTENEQDIWAAKAARVRQVAEDSDGYCIELFLALFGGMGSLNDLVLNAPPSVNEKLNEERLRAYKLAEALK